MKSKFAYVTAIVSMLIVLLTSCQPASQPAIDLSSPGENTTPTPANGQAPLRIAVAAMISPDETFNYYRDLLNYIGKKLGRPVELVQRETYAEVNDMLEARQLDAAFVCAGPYVTGHDKFGMELVAAPVVNGEPVYYAYIIVPVDSAAQSLDDLRGKKFAFTDPDSNTGKIVPTYMLGLKNETPESFFGSFIFTHSHDNSIRSVADKLVDGASVDSLIYDYLAATQPELTQKTRIIEKSPKYGIPPFVVHPDTDPKLKQQLAEILLSMHEDPEGLQILKNLNIEYFIKVEDSLYDSVREMVRWLEEQEQ